MIFIRIATGLTSDSPSLSVKARPFWIKIYPTLHLSESHPLSLNLAFDLISSPLLCLYNNYSWLYGLKVSFVSLGK